LDKLLKVPNLSRVLVIDDDAEGRDGLAKALEAAGFAVEVVSSSAAATQRLSRGTPSLILLDLTAAGFEALRAVRADPRTARVPVLVLAPLESDDDVTRAFDMGADDFVREPIRYAEVIARVRWQLRMRGYADALERRERDAKVVLELTQALCSTLDFRSVLSGVVRRVAEVVEVARCSIVLAREGAELGYTVASSDGDDVPSHPLRLSEHPDIRAVLRSGEMVAAPDAALLPIVFEGKTMGALVLDGWREVKPSRDHEIALARTVAGAMGVALCNARTLQSMRVETQKGAFARFQAEHRLSTLQRYADFFDSAADGILVTDRSGRVLFSNPHARVITARSEEELAQEALADLIDPADHARFAEIWRDFAEGRVLGEVDLTIRRTYETFCERRILSVSFGSVLLEESGAVLVSFRDVTADRAVAAELTKTKQFLERVIDSSASAIISTSMSGTVLLWNRAAERISGYGAAEVTHRKNIRDIYPPGMATRIRRLIHSRDHGGMGRLEDYRAQVLAKDGSYVPIRLATSLIWEGDQPVGAVSLLVDLRDHLRVELRLTEAEEKLRDRENGTLIAELAGAAAHELNQPLTSVLGYAGLIRKRLDDPEAVWEAAGVIMHEAERMAAIVRKIGKITRYETKSYVGTVKIVDIDRSSDDPEPSPEEEESLTPTDSDPPSPFRERGGRGVRVPSR
jgi:PAS domain S-box-containing protein